MPAPCYAALHSEITSDPLGRGYAGLSDTAVAADMNDLRISVQGDSVTLQVLAAWAAPAIRARVEAAALNPGSPVQSICLTVRDMLVSLSGPPLHFTTQTLAMMDALIAAGILTADDRTSLLGLGSTLTSRALSLPGWGIVVTDLDIAVARSH